MLWLWDDEETCPNEGDCHDEGAATPPGGCHDEGNWLDEGGYHDDGDCLDEAPGWLSVEIRPHHPAAVWGR